MDHPTVVPVNFDPDGRDETGDPESTLAGAAER
ncbi:hypothetical protein SAMN06264867_101365 [Halorubrum cibi]|uniref:Uncharacterized protein n=1 Tax=Halorubrum cibi TaxID=413815 RepID=A0A521ATF8_9EURY|nr:hypothetical protein SAMN06264867_101365 [Halorubrum cibi]